MQEDDSLRVGGLPVWELGVSKRIDRMALERVERRNVPVFGGHSPAHLRLAQKPIGNFHQGYDRLDSYS